jgi:hypothetical protein
MMKFLAFVLLLLSATLFSQDLKTPLEQNNFESVTSYNQLLEFVNLLDQESDLLKVEVIGKSVEGRNLFALKFSSGEFGKDNAKIKVLIFAQQHGNEQSGKEGALLLAQTLIRQEFRYLFDKIDLAIVPQVNPDGSEINQRRNGNNVDLNRNHLILTEPETMAMHRLFGQYLFEVTMDVHEYYPYDEEWIKYGYRKNSDVTLGTTTNINVSEEIRNFSSHHYLPWIMSYLHERNFSAFEYCPGGPPEEGYLRHSTFDINDGRQSFGIQNTFSFIQEGMNGEDSYVQNIRYRANGQMSGMLGLLEFTYQNKKKLKSIVTSARSQLIAGDDSEQVVVQMQHAGINDTLILPVYAYHSKSDSVVIVKDYRPKVIALSSVSKPLGYLIPIRLKKLVDWVERQALIAEQFEFSDDYTIEQFKINRIETIDFEGDTIVNPIIDAIEFTGFVSSADYLFIPSAQLKGNLIVQALEPKSMLGLGTNKSFEHLLDARDGFPVLRVVKK